MRFGGIVLAALLVLGACTSDPQPKEPEPSATTATPTTSPPSMPAQAKKDTPEGAAAFVKHYIEVFNYASRTGDVEELRRMSTRCDACSRYASEFEEIYKRGDQISAHLWTLKSLDLEQNSKANLVTANVEVDEGRLRRYDFLFRLPARPPFEIQTITILEQS